MQRLLSIQVLRGVAASLVVAEHVWRSPTLSCGVDIFFVLSGFIISKAAEGKGAGQFLKARAIRILPVYWACAMPWVLIAIAGGIFTLPTAITTLTLWPIVGGLSYSVLKSSWTLSFEMLFYLGMAVCLLWRKAVLIVPLVWLACLLGALATGSDLLRFLGNPLIAEFGFGVLIAQMRAVRWWLGLIALGFAAVLFVLAGLTGLDLQNPEAVFTFGQPWRWVLWGIPAALTVWGALQIETRLSARMWAFPLLIGDASYSLYLTNLLVTALLGAVCPAPALFVVCILIGLGAYRYIERPMTRWLNRRPVSPMVAPQAA